MFGSQQRDNCAPRAGCWVREGVAPPAVRVRGYHPRKILENSDAESCIMVTTMFISGLPKTCEQQAVEAFGRKISCFLKTTAKKWGGNTLLVPNLKVGGPVSPGPYGCCIYVTTLITGYLWCNTKMIVFHWYFADDDWHYEDRCRMCWVDLVQRDTRQSSMSGQRQATDGRIPPVRLPAIKPFTAAIAKLLANVARNRRARLQAVESLEQLCL